MDLDEVADELYGLLPQEFTAARDDRARRARAEGQRELATEIRSLRRPTQAAWAGNLLVREQSDQVEPLLRLGEELRGAHRDLDGQELRALSRKQHQLVDALTRQAARLAASAGQPLGAQAQQEVAQTLHAVLTDPEAAQHWAEGRLSKPLTATPGFDAAVREAAATAADGERRPKAKLEPSRRAEQPSGKARSGKSAQKTPSPRPAQKTADTRKGSRKTADTRKAANSRKTTESRKQAWSEARAAADESKRLRGEAEAAAEETATARAEREEAEERVELLREEMREAEEARKQARKREREAERAEREARRRAEKAKEAADQARRKAGR